MIKVIKYGLGLIIKAYPVFFFVELMIGVAHSLSRGIAVLYTNKFFDSIEDTLVNGGPLKQAIAMIVLLGLALIAREVIEACQDLTFGVLFNKPQGEMMKAVHAKIAGIEPICFEDSKFHDSIEKVHSGVDGVLSVNSYVLILTSVYLPYSIFMAVYLFSLQPYLVWAIVFAFIPTLIAQLSKSGIVAKFEDESAPKKRMYKYYGKAITDRQYFKETRKLGIYRFFICRVIKSLSELSAVEWRRSKRIFKVNILSDLLTALGYAGILILLVYALLSGDISAGAFAAVFSSIGLLFNTMNDIIKEGIGDLSADMGKARYFIEFMELPERNGVAKTAEYEKGIIVKDVSFAYPGNDFNSVESLSVEVNGGETIAIVGENGAGKTTLVRLLTGLYTPTHGAVILNGMDTATASFKSLFSSISGVFQHFQRYQMTLDENVKIADRRNSDEADSVLAEIGIDWTDTNTFPDGKHTMLSREFDGVDLSGGQWQRVAIARGLYRAHGVIVLDEPTSSIDPLEESRIYRKFTEISKGKTSIIVTHRLGSTKIADRIIVMEKGKLIGFGTHEELMKKCNPYADMYSKQAVWYESTDQKS